MALGVPAPPWAAVFSRALGIHIVTIIFRIRKALTQYIVITENRLDSRVSRLCVNRLLLDDPERSCRVGFVPSESIVFTCPRESPSRKKCKTYEVSKRETWSGKLGEKILPRFNNRLCVIGKFR